MMGPSAGPSWQALEDHADHCLQNVTGWFTLPGSTSIPFIYTVSIVRDGRSYSTRTVNVTQGVGRGICFTCTCSFKRDEEDTLFQQHMVDLQQKYSSVLEGKAPEEHPQCPGADFERCVRLNWYIPLVRYQ